MFNYLLKEYGGQFISDGGVIVGRRPYRVTLNYVDGEKVKSYDFYGKDEKECQTIISKLKRYSDASANFVISPITYVTDLDLSKNYDTSIGKYAFENQGITSVKFNPKTSIISKSSFKNNEISEIVLPDELGVIGEEAFADNNIKSVVIPKKVRSIKYGAFAGNPIEDVTYLEDLEYNQLAKKQEGLTYLGMNSFDSYKKDFVEIPSTVSIYTNAFSPKTKVMRKKVSRKSF